MPEPTPAALWRRQPYRLFFPLGLLLVWAGVLHWLLHSVGVLADYRLVFHAIAQIQGFMTCFAVGFLMTAIPGRTSTEPAATWQIVLGLALPVATTIAAWFQRLAMSQIAWMLLIVVLVGFAVPRMSGGKAGRRPPDGFIWIPAAFAMGIAGSILTGAPGVFGPEYQSIHDLGRLLLLQGMFLGLIAGVGAMVLPLLTCGDAPPDAASASRSRLARAGHLFLALLLAASFVVENSYSLRGGYVMRLVIVLIVLVLGARLWRLPRVAGAHRWLVWLSAWMLPAGYLLAALFPAQKKAGLHVVFIGGFALLAFSVALHVTLAHGGYERLVRGRPWQVPVYGALVLISVGLRALVDFDPNRFFLWIGASAATFLLGSIFWASLVLPRLWSKQE